VLRHFKTRNDAGHHRRRYVEVERKGVKEGKSVLFGLGPEKTFVVRERVKSS